MKRIVGSPHFAGLSDPGKDVMGQLEGPTSKYYCKCRHLDLEDGAGGPLTDLGEPGSLFQSDEP